MINGNLTEQEARLRTAPGSNISSSALQDAMVGRPAVTGAHELNIGMAHHSAGVLIQVWCFPPQEPITAYL